MSKGRQIEIVILFIVISFALLYLFCEQTKNQKFPELNIPQGFTALFNGENFSGWQVIPENTVFSIEDNMILCSGESGFPNVLLTEKKYENFILHIDFKIHPAAKTGNSGIFIHAPAHGRQSKNGFEIQILDTFNEPPTKTSAGAIYDLVAPDTNAIRAVGEWNHYEITMDWPKLQVSLNGAQIQDVDLSTEHYMKYRRRIGYIGLQNHENPIAFQNIFIKELPSQIKYETLFNGENTNGWQVQGAAEWQAEGGCLKVTGGPGWLISEKEYQNFEFLALVRNNPSLTGGVYFRWQNESDPGYLAEFYNLENAIQFTNNGKEVPEGALPVFRNYDYLPFQVLAFNRQSEVRINGSVAAFNLAHQKIRPGKIALFIPEGNEVIYFQEILVRELTEW